MLEDWGQWVKRCIARLDHLIANAPRCAECGTRQVQIMNRNAPAQWKCRECRHSFEYEP